MSRVLLVALVGAIACSGQDKVDTATPAQETQAQATEQEQPCREGYVRSPAGMCHKQKQRVELPAYQVIDVVDQLRGGRHADILIQSYGPGDLTADVAFGIAREEGLGSAAFYKTRSAQRADYSASYAEKNPGALEAGYLGSVKGRQFTPTPYQ